MGFKWKSVYKTPPKTTEAGGKKFLQNFIPSRDGPVKSTKNHGDENTQDYPNTGLWLKRKTTLYLVYLQQM